MNIIHKKIQNLYMNPNDLLYVIIIFIVSTFFVQINIVFSMVSDELDYNSQLNDAFIDLKKKYKTEPLYQEIPMINTIVFDA